MVIKKLLPLHKYRAIITRTPEQSLTLQAGLHALGAEVLLHPVMALSSLALPAHIKQVSNPLQKYDGVVLTSRNAVKHFFSQFSNEQMENTRTNQQTLFACVGKSTAEALDSFGLRSNFQPSRAHASVLAKELHQAYSLSKWHILFPCSSQARPELPLLLKEAGARVESCPIYEPTATHPSPAPVLESLQQKNPHILLFASPSAVHYFVENIGLPELKKSQSPLYFASIGETTAKALRKWGLPTQIIPTYPGIRGLLKAIEDYFNQKRKLSNDRPME